MPKDDWKKNSVKNIFEEKGLWPWKDEEIDSILDVGCGLSLKSKFIKAKTRIGVDIYKKYFDHIESEVPYIGIIYDIRKLEEIFLPKSFDLILVLDVIEHLKKDESLALLKKCEKLAKKAIVIETPNGYIPQNLDIWGYGGHEFQTHRSGWNENEIKNLGYQTILKPYKMNDTKRHTDIEVDPNVELIYGIKILN